MAEQPDLRASDTDRERVAEVLRLAGGEGQLDVQELDERLDAAYAARTHGELARLTEDLSPVGRTAGSSTLPVRPGDEGTRWVVSIMGGNDRRGHWRIGRRCTVLNVMGGGDIDLNDAELADDVTEIRVWSLMGGSTMYVPDGADVEVSSFAFMGGNGVKLGSGRPPRGGPKIRVKLISIMGGTDVKRGRRRSRRERREQLKEELEQRALDDVERFLRPPRPPEPPR